VVCPVINVLPNTAIGDNARAFQLRQMAGNARLAHAENLLQLRNGKLFLLEKKNETHSSRISQQSQQIKG
jgi:hypothetical protein